LLTFEKELINIKEITFELTNKCFNNCLHCSTNASSNYNDELDKLDINIIKETIDKYDPEWVNLSGGEPLLYPDIYNLLEYLQTKNVKVKMYTSGDGWWGNDIKKLSFDKYINTIVFPFYSNRNNIFNFIANKDLYSTVLSNLRYSLKTNMNVEVHIVPMTINIYTLEETIDYLINLGVKKINLLKLVNQGRCVNNQYLILDDRILKEQMDHLYTKYKDVVKLGLPLSHGKCTAGIEKLVVMCDGKIIPCESYKDGVCKCERI